jgi:hypothetical protein
LTFFWVQVKRASCGGLAGREVGEGCHVKVKCRKKMGKSQGKCDGFVRFLRVLGENCPLGKAGEACFTQHSGQS